MRTKVRSTNRSSVYEEVKQRGETFRDYPILSKGDYAKLSPFDRELRLRSLGCSKKLEEEATDEDFSRLEEDWERLSEAERYHGYILSLGAEAQGVVANKIGNKSKEMVKKYFEQACEDNNISYRWFCFPSSRKHKNCLVFPERALLFDYKCQLQGVKCNLDYILVDYKDYDRNLYGGTICESSKHSYHAVGELKGGKDKAAVRERCKEAFGSLHKLHSQSIKSFLIFGHITEQVADDLNSGDWWDKCAHLGSKTEMSELANWLVRL